MKQTILSKCFSKMKRVALTLFAALCVGSVWAADVYTGWIGQTEYSTYGSIYVTLVDVRITPEGAVAFNYDINQIEKFNKNIPSQTYDVKVTYTIESRNFVYEKQETPIVIANGGYSGMLTSETFLEGVQNGENIKIVLDIRGNLGVHATLEETAKYVSYGDLTATWEMGENKNFLFNGVNFKGWARAKLYYAINSDVIGENCEIKEVNIENNAFNIAIPYVRLDDYIKWKLELFDSAGNKSIYEDITGNTEFLLTRKEKYVVYTWKTDKTVGTWGDYVNWTADVLANYGYPGTRSGGNYISKAVFNSNAEVDLDGKTYYLLDNNRGFSMSEGITVKIKKGTLGFQPHNDGNAVQLNLGAKNSTLHLNNVEMPYNPNEKYDETQEGYYEYNVKLATDSTFILEGNQQYIWRFLPGNKGTKFKVKNGVIKTKHKAAAPGTNSEVEISNAVWIVSTHVQTTKGMANESCDKGLAERTIFRDGDNQARLILRESLDSGTYYVLKLLGTYDIKLSARGNQHPYVEAGKVHTTVNKDGNGKVTSYETHKCKIEVDATALVGEAKVPLMKFTSPDAYTNETMAEMVDPKNNYLKVIVDGKEVDNSKYGASLVWDGNILYYQRVEPKVAEITKKETDDAGNETEVTNKYVSLEKAIAAANGDTIKLLADIEAPTAFVIVGENGAKKTVTIDLNGKTVKANDTDAATDGNGVFWVQAGGVLTLEDSSETKAGTVDGNGGNDYKMAIWADGGKVVINAGNYVNDNDGTQNQYDLIYAKNGGEIVINGGTFKCDTPRWTLNSHNTKTGRFVVTGGKFYQYNPTNFDTDEAVTTWCDAKYRAEAEGDWFVVKEGYTVTTEASAVTVTADIEAEALAQVDFSVTTPEGVDATAYKNYFKLVATETAEGSKTWTVALALKDELKPVIAETTADDTTKEAFVIDANGNVTLNINNKKPGLYYGVQVLKELGADPVAVVPETEVGTLVVPAENLPDGNAAFFRVVVDFEPIPEAK